MSRRPAVSRTLHVSSVAALVLVVGGGGVAVAAGVARNAVGSPQVKNGSLTSQDVRDNGLTGADVREATLATVPRAKAVDTVTTSRADAVVNQVATVASFGSLVTELRCVDNGGGTLRASLEVRTTADGAVLDADEAGVDEGDFTTADGPREVASVLAAGQGAESVAYVAMTPQGQLVTVTGAVVVNPGGNKVCRAVLTQVR